MRNYSEIDPLINEWVEANELTLMDSYNNKPIRSVNIYDAKKLKWLVWIKPEDEQWCIYWWNYTDISRSVKSSTKELGENLQSVFDILKSTGH